MAKNEFDRNKNVKERLNIDDATWNEMVNKLEGVKSIKDVNDLVSLEILASSQSPLAQQAYSKLIDFAWNTLNHEQLKSLEQEQNASAPTAEELAAREAEKKIEQLKPKIIPNKNTLAENHAFGEILKQAGVRINGETKADETLLKEIERMNRKTSRDINPENGIGE